MGPDRVRKTHKSGSTSCERTVSNPTFITLLSSILSKPQVSLGNQGAREDWACVSRYSFIQTAQSATIHEAKRGFYYNIKCLSVKTKVNIVQYMQQPKVSMQEFGQIKVIFITKHLLTMYIILKTFCSRSLPSERKLLKLR